jgi:hypothetical protein
MDSRLETSLYNMGDGKRSVGATLAVARGQGQALPLQYAKSLLVSLYKKEVRCEVRRFPNGHAVPSRMTKGGGFETRLPQNKRIPFSKQVEYGAE